MGTVTRGAWDLSDPVVEAPDTKADTNDLRARQTEEQPLPEKEQQHAFCRRRNKSTQMLEFM